MARPTRHNSQKRVADLKTDHPINNPNQEDGDSSVIVMVNPTPYDIISFNTDNKTPAKPGGNLLASRNNQVVTTLEDNAELVSVVVQAYNRLEKTKICIECILKYTTSIEYELILIDNGSTDGTLEYFKTVNHPRKKIIHVSKNVGSLVPNIMNQWTGRYLVFITNDAYVTKNWLSNLLTCMKSADDIGLVVPVSSNISNLQQGDITFNSLDEMQEKAAKFNISNPGLWHERIRLLPVVGLYRKEALDITGWVDYGFFHDFADDDISFRIRRTGYKTILCKDTFVHHDHVYTDPGAKNPEEFGRSLLSGRQDFKSKYFGIDAWDDVNNYETGLLSLIDSKDINGRKGIKILGIDVSCGSPILELKNIIKENHSDDVKLSAFVTDPKYWLDLKTICTGNVIVDQIDRVNSHFEFESFDFIVLGKPINAYSNSLDVLGNLLKLMKKNGSCLLKLWNTFDIMKVLRTLGANILVTSTSNPITNPDNNVFDISLDQLLNYIELSGFTAKNIAVENWPLGENFHQIFRNTIAASGLSNKPDEIFNRALIRDYLIEISRK